jgi:very-short-patch-repair endonuclease
MLVVDPRTAIQTAIRGDGAQHAWFANYDVGRSEIRQSHGVRVIRFTNEEVCGDIDSVLARIRAELRIPFG